MILTWHGEPKLKEAALSRLREHRRMDQIVQRVYWQEGKGCNLGCLTHQNRDPHEALERLFGIPLVIGYWMEGVFEGLQEDKCADWVVDSAEAIPVGADITRCKHEFSVWLPGDSGLLTINDVNRSAIQDVCRLHERVLRGEIVNNKEWLSAARSARSVAESARSVAESARSVAESARWAAAAAWWAAAAARSEAESAWEKIAAKSLEIFRSAPIRKSCDPLPKEIQDELCCSGIWCKDDSVVSNGDEILHMKLAGPGHKLALLAAGAGKP